MWYTRVGISCKQRVMMLLPTTRYHNQKLTICVTVAISKKKRLRAKESQYTERKYYHSLKSLPVAIKACIMIVTSGVKRLVHNTSKEL